MGIAAGPITIAFTKMTVPMIDRNESETKSKSVGWSVDRSISRSVGWSVDRSVGRSVGRSVDRSVGKKRGENSEVVREILPGLIRPGSNTSYNFHFADRGNTARPVRLMQTSQQGAPKILEHCG